MYITFNDISWISIAAATATSFILGGIWFTVLFGKTYAFVLGREYIQNEKPSAIFILAPALWSFLTTIVTSLLINALGIETVKDAFYLGALIGFGYLATTTINTGFNPNIPKPLLYGALSGTYHLVAGITIAVVLVIV